MHQLYKLINRILITLSTHLKFQLFIFAIIFYIFYFLHQTINNDFITVIRCQLAHSKAERIRSKLQIYNTDLDLHPRNTRLILENLRRLPRRCRLDGNLYHARALLTRRTRSSFLMGRGKEK